MEVNHRTGPLKKADLTYPYHPDVHGSDDLMYWSEPSVVDLRRHDWYEMLYFVNKFANTEWQGSQDIAKRAERLIQEYVPSYLRRHDQIRQWLLDHWDLVT